MDVLNKLIEFQSNNNLLSLDFYNTFLRQPTKLSYISVYEVKEWYECCVKYLESDINNSLTDLDKYMYN